MGEVGFRYWKWSGRINGHHRIEWKNPRQGYPKKKIRMHEPCANLEFPAFAIRGKVTHAPKLSIVQAFDKKKKTRKKKIFTLSCYFWRFKYIRCNCHIIDSKNKEQQHSLHIWIQRNQRSKTLTSHCTDLHQHIKPTYLIECGKRKFFFVLIFRFH